MAASVFIGQVVSNGSQVVFSQPGAFPDGLVGAPGITFANELNSGFYRAASHDIRFSLNGVDFAQFSGSTLSVLVASGIAVPSGASFGANANFFITGTGSGLLTVQNPSASAGFGIDTTTDAVFKLRTRAQTGYATLDCLGLKSSGAAGASGTGTVLTALTVVNGIVTAITIS